MYISKREAQDLAEFSFKPIPIGTVTYITF